ncbi:MAG: hypothetical protein IJ866_02685 [Alphaproteobacteria bacterium]|nr:hypothetical protein [Alphaproteobacteria bacterium]
MTRLNRIFAVSFIAMLAVPTVHAKVVTQTNIVGANGVSVTVPTNGTNAGKVQISGPTVDSALSSSSTNAVQNKVVNSALAGKQATISDLATIRSNATAGKGAADTIAEYGDIVSHDASEFQVAGSYVPTSRTVNSKALSGNITLSGADIAATGYTKPNATSAIAATDTVNAALGKLEKALDGKQASGSYVPTSRTVNGKALSSNISLGASDVGAVPTSRTVNSKALSGDITLSGADVAVTGYAKAETAAAIEATDTVNAALGKLEKALDGKQASGSYVPTSRTVNGKALSSNISLGASDVGAVATAQGSSAASKAVITNSSGNVTTGTIATGMITDGAVTTAKITDGNVTTAKIAGSAVTSAKIADGTIVNADIADGTIAKAKLASAVQTSLGKADTALQNLAATYDDTVSEDTKKATAASVYAAEEIAAGAAGASAATAAASALTQAKSYTDTEVAKKVTIAQGSSAANKAVITNSSGNVTTGTIATGMITDGAVTTAKITDANVTTAKIADSAVTSAKIANGTIVDADISTSAAIAQSKISGLTTALANAQNKIPSGSENSTTLASIWVE